MKVFKKSPDRDFVVLNLTDIHMSRYEWARRNTYGTLFSGTLKELVERVHPDLITVTGDFAWAGELDAYERTAVELDRFGIPWAPIWGNHDQQEGQEVTDMEAEQFMRHPLCCYEHGDPKLGGGNYVIRIEEGDDPVAALIMMNSNNRSPWTNEKGEQKDDWAHLEPEQLRWYEEQIRALGSLQNAVLMHIPIHGYRDAWKAAWNGSNWNPGYENCTGTQLENIASYPDDRGETDVFAKSGTTRLMLCGHDHVNDFVIPWRGMRLAYAVKIGAGCYWNPVKNGGTVLRINREGIALEQEYVDPKKYVDIRVFEKKD